MKYFTTIIITVLSILSCNDTKQSKLIVDIQDSIVLQDSTIIDTILPVKQILTFNTSDSLASNRYPNNLELVDIYELMVEVGIIQPEIVLSQIIYETGYLSSAVLKKYNNFGGFHNGSRYLHFENKQSGLNYIKQWQDDALARATIQNPEQNYYNFLDTLRIDNTGKIYRYSTNEHYVEYIKTNLEQVIHIILLPYSDTYRNRYVDSLLPPTYYGKI